MNCDLILLYNRKIISVEMPCIRIAEYTFFTTQNNYSTTGRIVDLLLFTIFYKLTFPLKSHLHDTVRFIPYCTYT